MTELRTNVAFIVPVVVGCVGFCGWIFGRHIDVALSQFIVMAQRVMVLRGYQRLEFSDAFACAVAFPAFWFFIGVQRGADTLTIKSFLPLLTGVALVVLGLIGRDHLRIAMMIVVLEFVVVVLMHFFVHRLEWDELSFLLFFCFLLHYYLSRADWPHWRPLLVAAALLTPFLFVSRYTVERREFELSTSTGTALSVLAIVIFVLVATPDFRPEITMLPNGLRLIADLLHDRTSTDSDRMLGTGPSPAAWNYVYPDTDELMTIRYIRQRSNDSTPLFVGSVDHSRVFFNDLRMYWLADRPIGVRTFQLEARIATEAPVQLEIVANLEQDKRTWIVLDNASVGDDGISAHPAGSKLLDNYISDHFRQEARFGNYLIFTRVND